MSPVITPGPYDKIVSDGSKSRRARRIPVQRRDSLFCGSKPNTCHGATDTPTEGVKLPLVTPRRGAGDNFSRANNRAAFCGSKTNSCYSARYRPGAVRGLPQGIPVVRWGRRLLLSRYLPVVPNGLAAPPGRQARSRAPERERRTTARGRMGGSHPPRRPRQEAPAGGRRRQAGAHKRRLSVRQGRPPGGSDE